MSHWDRMYDEFDPLAALSPEEQERVRAIYASMMKDDNKTAADAAVESEPEK
jgi:predicted aminopeptidase